MRKDWICDGKTLIAFDTIHGPLGRVVALSFYALDSKMPGFNMCFPFTTWKEFQREVADYDPQS